MNRGHPASIQAEPKSPDLFLGSISAPIQWVPGDFCKGDKAIGA